MQRSWRSACHAEKLVRSGEKSMPGLARGTARGVKSFRVVDFYTCACACTQHTHKRERKKDRDRGTETETERERER